MIALLALVLSFIGSVSCVPCLPPVSFNVIFNPSFEVGACPPLGWTNPNPATTPCSANWPIGFGHPASDGTNALFFPGYPSANVFTVSTTIGGLTAGKRYRLSFDVAPQTCNTAACAGPGNPTDAKVNVGLTPSDATTTLVTVSFPEPTVHNAFIPWIRKSIAFTPTASSVTLTLTEVSPTTGSLAFGVDNFAVEPLPCAAGINLELLVNSQTGTSTTDPALALTSQDAVRVDVSKGQTHTVDDGATYITADGGAPIGACPGAGTPTAPSLALPRGALLYTFDDVHFFPLPSPADRPFTIRGPSSTPTQLKFIINDCSDERTANPGKNNFGSVTVLVRSFPTLSCETVFGGCTPTTATVFAIVPFNGPSFQAGESIVFTATGVWGTNQVAPAPVLQAAFDADGFQGTLPVGMCTPILPSAKFGALIGSFDGFGAGSHPFLVGKGPIAVKNFGCDAPLQLTFNDCGGGFAFHTGQLSVSFCSRQTTFNADPDVCVATINFSPAVVSDKCPGSVVSPTSPLVVGVAPQSLFFTAVDDQAEFARCVFNFNVIDNQAPKFTVCPSNIVVNAANGVCNAFVGAADGYNTPIATDNCAGVAVVNLTPLFGVGAQFPVGTTTVTWQASDVGGLKTNCTFTVKVVDNQKPTITCPSPQSYCAGSFIPLGAPTSAALDNCPAPVVTVSSPVGFNGLVPTGTTSVTLGAKDAAGNVATTSCTFSLTGVAENGGCGGTNKCIATQCVSGCIANVDLTGCNVAGGDNFAYQYGVGKKACTKIIRDPADSRNVIIGNVGGWSTVPADAGTEAVLDTFVGTFKMVTTGFPVPTVRTFTQVSGGTKSIELKATVTPTAVCSMKFNGSDRKRAATSLVLGGGAAPFPAI